jgi:uncharacterized protein YjiS (DUF1127 family)
LPSAISPRLIRACDLLLEWIERIRDRRTLEKMSVRDLNDIGLNRVDVERESSKPFWQK